MQPHVQYFRGRDGERVGYTSIGDGPPLIFVPPWGASNFQMIWERAEGQDFFGRLAIDRRVAFLARRGTSLSSMCPFISTVEAQAGDIAALVEHLAVDRVDLWGNDDGATLAMSYAAQSPHLVAHLVLWAPYRRTLGFSHDAVRGLVEIVRSNWALARRTFADLNFPTGPEDLRRWFSDLHRESLSPEVAARYLEFSADADVRGDLEKIASPTLVILRRGDRVIAAKAGRSVVGDIANARMIELAGDIHLPYFGDTSFLAAVEGFLRDRTVDIREQSRIGRFRVVLFTDLVGHTEMMQRLGDQGGREVLRAHERLTRELLGQHGGTEVKTLGDGFMASFDSVTAAVGCAVELQRAFAAWNHGVGAWGKPPIPLDVRVGLNAGEPIEDEGDLFGSTVILASRIAAQAGPSEILVSETVRGLLSGKGFAFSDRGQFVPKGFDEGVRLWDVQWQE